MTYEPFISYEQLHMMVLAFLVTCIAIPVGGMLYSWIVSLTHLRSRKIVIPSYDFGPERSPLVHIVSDEDMEMMLFDRPRPFDWSQAPYNWEEETD
jgi:hypothetical protein